jgi:hypothetical protein
MPNAKLMIKEVELNQYGKDEIILEIDETKINELSFFLQVYLKLFQLHF